MVQLIYSQAELEAEVDDLSPHEECGLKLHGGFDSENRYTSPRTKYRWQAVNAWEQQLLKNDVVLVSATTELLTEPNFPNVRQQLFLLENGVEQALWDSLTITGIVEGRGRALVDLVAPDFQKIIVEDIGSTSLGHINKGLLRAHGWDEGGREDSGLGGHDTMWYAVRDLIFGKGKYPQPSPPDSIGREINEREMEQIPPEYESMLSLFMNVLMIEVRAEKAFRYYEDVIGESKALYNTSLAVTLVNRVRTDEAIHVAWLRTAISEFGHFTIKTANGPVKGWDIIGPVWEKMVHWHSVGMHKANREANVKAMEALILTESKGSDLLDEFRSLGNHLL